MSGRIPDVTEADVLRVVQRDFSPRDQADALDRLEEYGTERTELEIARVRLAVLKLANGDLTRLNREIHSAKIDYRDVLAYAEYPNAMMSLESSSNKDSDQANEIRTRDWEQYQAWLNRV